MKIVLRKDVENLGEIDDIVAVAAGYARNYLVPRKLAVLATKKELLAVNKRSAARDKRIIEKKVAAEAVAQQLAALSIKILVDVGESGKLFGSVTSQDLAAEILKTAKLEINRRSIHLSEPIKTLGEHKVNVKVYRDVTATIKVVVEKKPHREEPADGAKEAD